MTMMETRLKNFADMMTEVWKIFFWHYDSEDRLISTTCPEAQLFSSLFTTGGSKERIVDECNQNKKAAMVADSTGLAWIGVPYFIKEVFVKLFVMGPVFSSEVSESAMIAAISEKAIPIEQRTKMLEYLVELPVIQPSMFRQFGIMLQHQVNGEIVGASDIQIIASGSIKASLDRKTPGHEVEGSYNYESKLMKAIESGDIHFKRPPHPPKVGKLSKGDPLRQAKNEMLVFTTLASRAALRGGMPEETAYGLSDQYIQRIEEEKDISEVYASGSKCYNDFLHRMHKIKLSQGRSREILNCVAYIEAHLRDKIDYEDMAKKCGYSRNYLSVKFKSEMGISMVDYIASQRIEQAKLMLRNTQDSVTDIAAALKFSSNSYFGAIFHKIVGVTPKDYRNGMDGG